MVANLTDWFASQKGFDLPFDSSDADLFLDIDFRDGEAAVNSILETTEGLTKTDDGVATWDSTLGVNPNGGLSYSANDYVPSAFVDRAAFEAAVTELTVYMEVERSALSSIWLDDGANFIDNSIGPSADAWDGSIVTAANHRYGDYTAATKIGYFYWIGGNAVGTPFMAVEYQVSNNAGFPAGRARFSNKYGATAKHITARIHADFVSDSNIDSRFSTVVQTIDADNYYNLYIDGRLVNRVKRDTTIAADNLFYYMRIFGNAANTTNTPHGYVRRLQVAKRAVYNHLMKGPRVAIIGDSFVQSGCNHDTPATTSVAALDAVQNGLTNAPLANNLDDDCVIIGAQNAPFMHMLRDMAGIYGLRFPFYGAGDSGHGWSDTVGVGTSQIRSHFINGVIGYDPEILLCLGSVNDVNTTNPPTDLLAETKALLDSIVQSCRDTRHVLFFQTFPGHKGDNVGDSAWLTEYKRQIALQEGLDGYEITNARGDTVTVEFIKTYEPLGGDDYNAQFSLGGAAETEAWDAVYTQTTTDNNIHPGQYGFNRMVEIMWPHIKRTILSVAD